MSKIQPLILGMALFGALGLLKGTFVTIPAVNAAIGYQDPNERIKSTIPGGYGNPNE